MQFLYTFGPSMRRRNFMFLFGIFTLGIRVTLLVFKFLYTLFLCGYLGWKLHIQINVIV